MNAVKNLFVLTSTMAAILASAPAAASASNPATNHFYVTIRIMPVCEVQTSTGSTPTETENTPSNGADIDFGNHFSNSNQEIQGTSKAGPTGGIEIKCTKGTPYKIALKPASTNNTNGEGTMNGLGIAGTDKIAYSLYQDSSHSKKWGSEDNLKMQGVGTGIGSPISHPVYGKVAGTELDKTAGHYFDRVAVEVSY